MVGVIHTTDMVGVIQPMVGVIHTTAMDGDTQVMHGDTQVMDGVIRAMVGVTQVTVGDITHLITEDIMKEPLMANDMQIIAAA